MTARKHEGADAWKIHLLVSSTGAPKPLLANAITAFRESMTWQNVLSFDAFSLQTYMDGPPPWHMDLSWDPRPWTPQDDLLATNWLQQQGIGVNSATTAQAVEAVSRDCQFHPVLDYLDSLTHDGTARTRNWLATYMGAEPSDYNKAVGCAMLIAAVARIRNPGCKVDTVPIFEGLQGSKKSTAIKALFYPWFSDDLADLGSKDAVMQTRGVWGIEISELDAMSRGEVSKIKAFISRTTDRFRPPYGNRIIESERTCVFWGSTNADGYLKDETGGRRFWPVKIGKIDVDALAADRDQLWAEAQILYDANVPWWLVKDEIKLEAERQQAQRYVGDPWDAAIARYAGDEIEVTLEKVLRDGLQIELARCGQLEMNRVSRSLRSLGYQRVQRRSGDKRVWVYRKPVTSGDGVEPGDNVTTFRPVTPSQPVTPETAATQARAPQSPVSPVF